MDSKPRIMLHIIMPNQVSGPNSAMRRLSSSYLKDMYEFNFFSQNFHAGGKINIKLIRDLYHQIKAFDPDLVHISGLQSSGFHAMVAAKLAHKKVLMAIRGFAVDDLSLDTFKRFIFGHIIEPLTISMANGYYTVCQAAGRRKEISRHRRNYLGTIHNAAPNVDVSCYGNREEKRKKFGLEKDDIVVAISGRMVHDKGIGDIVSAILQLYKNNPDSHFKFMFIGDGPYCDVIKEKASKYIEANKVLCLGKRNDVLDLLFVCDIFLFATLHENLSNALLEAMAIGLPIIATNVGGNPEVVEDYINGYLIPPNAPEAIIEKLNLLSDVSIRRDFSKESLRIIREKFSQELLYQQTNNLYTKLLNLN